MSLILTTLYLSSAGATLDTMRCYEQATSALFGDLVIEESADDILLTIDHADGTTEEFAMEFSGDLLDPTWSGQLDDTQVMVSGSSGVLMYAAPGDTRFMECAFL